METYEMVMQAISTVGFPIVVTGFLLWDKYKNNQRAIEVQEKQNVLLGELKTLIKTLV